MNNTVSPNVDMMSSDLGMITMLVIFFGAVLGVALLIGAFRGIKIFLTSRRKSKILKRLRDKPTTEIITYDSLGIPILVMEEREEEDKIIKKYTFI